MGTRAFQYSEIVAGSNMAPLTLELRDGRTRKPLDLLGAEITITIIDETTGNVIVEAGEAAQSSTNPYWVEYFLTDQDAAKITAPSTWLAQWTLTAGNGSKHLVPTVCRIPVKPSVL